MKNIKYSIKRLFNILLTAVFLLAGCRAPAQIEATPTPIALPDATPEIKPDVGGELILPMPRNPFKTEDNKPLTPLNVTTDELKTLYSLVYDHFVRCDANNRIVPGLAEKWSVDEGGRVWTFLLRDNVIWHDGEGLLNADDVLYTLQAIRSYGEDSYYFPLVDEMVESAEREDDRTLRITMKQPGASALYALLFPVLRAGDSQDIINGTGPYKLTHAVATEVELSVNTRWWRQMPYIPTVRFLARASNDVALDSYDAGLLNVVPTSNVSAGKHWEEGVTNVLDVYTQDCEALIINFKNSALNDIAVRQAIAYGIDRSAIVSNIYMNKAVICDVPVPPDSFLYDSTSKIYDYQKNKAAALLSEAGWTEKNEEGILVKNGRPLRFRLLVNDSTENAYRKNAAVMLSAQLAQIGIEVIVEAERLSVGEDNGPYETRLVNGDFDMAMVGFNTERSGNLQKYLSRNGVRNYGGYSGDILNIFMDNAAAAIEEKDMRETHAALQQAFVQELPFITLYFRLSSLVYSASIHNVTEVRGSDILRNAYRWYINTVQE